MHPLLSPRLFVQAPTPPPRPMRARHAGPVRAWALRAATQLYLRHGRAAGFVLGLGLAWWFFAPDLARS